MITKNNEEWRDISGYEGIYQVSNFGNVRSLNRTVKHIDSFLQIKGKNIKSGLRNGYCFVTLYKNAYGKSFYVHRLVAQAFITNPNNLPIVNHIDGNKTNNHFDNLEFCSSAENNTHAYRTNLKKSGEHHYLAKLTAEQVKALREEYKKGSKDFNANVLAKKYGISQKAALNIINKKTYKNIK